MGKQILMLFALFCISSTVATCGDNVTKANTETYHQVARDVDLYKFTCDISEEGLTVSILETNEEVVCALDEKLEDWAWIPKKN